MQTLDYEHFVQSSSIFDKKVADRIEQNPQLVLFTLGLAGEAGEVAEKIKKFLRDGTPERLTEAQQELGDLLWYLSTVARLLGTDLEKVMEMNRAKLMSRARRKQMHGEGDNR